MRTAFQIQNAKHCNESTEYSLDQDNAVQEAQYKACSLLEESNSEAELLLAAALAVPLQLEPELGLVLLAV